MEKRLTNELPFCRLGPLMKIIEQAYRPHSSVEWHFACSMRSKGRHRAGVSAPQPPRTPLALLDELHEGLLGGRHKTADAEKDIKETTRRKAEEINAKKDTKELTRRKTQNRNEDATPKGRRGDAYRVLGA